MPWSQQHHWRRVGGRSADTIPAPMGTVWHAQPVYRTGRGARPWSIIAEMFLLHGLLTTVWEDWGEIIRSHDPDDYSGTPSHFFEAMLETTDASIAVRARLFNVTLGAAIAGSVIAANSTTPIRKRSNAFSLPSGDNEYRAQIGRST